MARMTCFLLNLIKNYCFWSFHPPIWEFVPLLNLRRILLLTGSFTGQNLKSVLFPF